MLGWGHLTEGDLTDSDGNPLSDDAVLWELPVVERESLALQAGVVGVDEAGNPVVDEQEIIDEMNDRVQDMMADANIQDAYYHMCDFWEGFPDEAWANAIKGLAGFFKAVHHHTTDFWCETDTRVIVTVGDARQALLESG